MELLTIDDILQATGGSLLSSGKQMETTFVSTDTRTVKPGDLFIALKGDKFDAHDFIGDALSKGCSMIIVSNPNISIPSHVTAINVPDTLTALGDLAAFYRQRYSFKVVAVTGSNGKTTTKDIIGTLLADKCDITITRGTRNNLIGVPLTILSASANQRILILEHGINQFGEMRRLGSITSPDLVVITNIAQSHLEFLENEDGVFKAKTEILSVMNPNGRLIFFHDDYFLPKVKAISPCPITTFGICEGADFKAKNIRLEANGSQFDLDIHNVISKHVVLPISGEHNICNFLAAAATIESLGFSWDSIAPAVEKITLPSMRFETVTINDITIINDAYNANPASTKVAVMELMRMESHGKKIMIFADMLELGAKKEQYHREIGSLLESSRLDVLITVGDLASLTADQIRENPQLTKIVLKKSEQVFPILRELLEAGDVVLLKGSRGNQLETIIDTIKELYKTETI
ncbi:MAG: UDP-N-acetylmuramoyl-tripeptide--D-alanyl-D-alanine ligase [Candidatus Auribacterota bacterium]|jgi:UDP-N-acetylmuramoyl-tripeptide--D-alanyl-D-alanine ligase|nr:UDP-N-acetylmuramoyl-tripeptide--D-alanyl-D-alanine ligase [Candidatus Auribacterota bacterium]